MATYNQYQQGLWTKIFDCIGHWKLTSTKSNTAPWLKKVPYFFYSTDISLAVKITRRPRHSPSCILSQSYVVYVCIEERLSWIEAEEKARLFSRYLSAPPQSLPHQVRVLPPGQCYCRFDYDWSEWSLSEEACKVALFQRARDPTSGLDQRMLVSYYDYKPSKVSGVLQPPHADQISAFLYSDCTPTPPCSCMGSMGNKLSQACINEIQIYAADPSRNVPSEILHDAVTEGNDDGRQIRAWAHLTFPTSSCDNFQGHPYVFVQLKLHIWADAWQRALGIGPWEGSPVLVVQILLASICFLVVLASLLVLKRLVQPCDK